MGILMSVALPVWRQAARREKEAELVFRGEQYARAIGLYQRRFAVAFPPSIDVLVEQRFLRRKYKDPMTEDGEFQVLYQASLAASAPGGGSAPSTLSSSGSQTGPSGSTGGGPRGGVIGVVSKSEEASIRLYNDRDHYNEWLFVYIATTTQVGGAPGVQQGGAGRAQQGSAQPGQFGSGGRGSPGRQGQRPVQPGAAGRPPGDRPSLAPTQSPGRPPG